jgi:hypothetical protein
MYSIKMLAIRISRNKRNIVLHESVAENIGVRLRSSHYRFLPWAGFADIELARRAGRPVQVLASAYTLNFEARAKWIECDHLQGCLVYVGDSLVYKVYVVTRDGVPVDISRKMVR